MKATSEKTQRDRLIKYKTRFPPVSMKNVALCEISTVNVRASIFYNATKHVTNSVRKSRSMPSVCHTHRNSINKVFLFSILIAYNS